METSINRVCVSELIYLNVCGCVRVYFYKSFREGNIGFYDFLCNKLLSLTARTLSVNWKLIPTYQLGSFKYRRIIASSFVYKIHVCLYTVCVCVCVLIVNF